MEGERNIVVNPEELMQPGEEAYRHRLKAPVFTGLEDVEQFIQEFSEVIGITQWPPRVALIQLRMALTEQAKPYELGTSVGPTSASLSWTPGSIYESCAAKRAPPPRPHYYGEETGAVRV